MNDSKPLVRLDEIAAKLDVPRHFLGKILKRLAKDGILISAKGPSGGFGISKTTLATPLIKILELVGQSEKADSCVLLLQKCDPLKPCPLHHHVECVKNDWLHLLSDTTIDMLLKKDQPADIRMSAFF